MTPLGNIARLFTAVENFFPGNSTNNLMVLEQYLYGDRYSLCVVVSAKHANVYHVLKFDNEKTIALMHTVIDRPRANRLAYLEWIKQFPSYSFRDDVVS